MSAFGCCPAVMRSISRNTRKAISYVRQKKAQQQGGIARTYADPMVMVEKERPDALLVTASVLSMLVEKPPCTSLAEAEELVALADRHETPVMVALNRRFYSVYHKALDIMGGRQAVTGVFAEWSEDPKKMLELGHPADLIPKLNYANSLHGIDLLTFLGGKIANPSAWGRNLDSTRREYRWQMSLAGVSESGVHARFDSSWDVPGRWRLVVDFAGARLVSAPLETGVLYRTGQPPLEIQPSEEDKKYKPGFHGQAAAFLSLVRREREPEWPTCSLTNAMQSLLFAESLTAACVGVAVDAGRNA